MKGVFGVGTVSPPRPLHPAIGKKPIGVRRLALWLACVVSLLAGTDLGILSSHNGGRSWVPEARDVIIGAVFALAFSPDGELAMCAAASGVFRRDRDGWLRAEAPESAIPARALVAA